MEAPNPDIVRNGVRKCLCFCDYLAHDADLVRDGGDGLKGSHDSVAAVHVPDDLG